MADYYLLANPNPHGDHFYRTRRSPLRVIVVHITASIEDLDYTDDQSAEATARYAATTKRKVSWHSGSDADSHLNLLPASYTAFHCQDYNSFSYGHEISKRTTDWTHADPEWVARTLTHAALAVAPVAREHGIPFIRQSRAAIDRGAKGFAAHADLDPKRRTDPGADFPWGRFLDLMAGTRPPTKEDKMVRLVKPPEGHPNQHDVLVTDYVNARHVNDSAELAELTQELGPVRRISAQTYDDLYTIGVGRRKP